MDPPPCVQNAMMTKDKKPFTYTPGGIDLSEIKSPRMARRIERNANYGGVSEVPRPPPPQNVGPLPPSALAAMNPQIQVQVLPSGGIPAPKGGPPPPPPPPAHAPPPPPMQPLPTQKVVTSNNQVVERPDMTKIIPDNPMALLRKTGGPQPRRSLVDDLFDGQAVRTPPATQYQAPEPPMRFHQPAAQSPQPTNNFNQVNNNNFNQVNNRVNNHVNNQSPKSPDMQYSSPEPQRYQSPEQQSPKPRFQAPAPIIERQPSITKPEPPVKTVTAQLGSLYIPPTNQQQNNQQRVVSPPSPPERMNSPQVQSPGTPTLKEAPRPWQKAPKQQEEVPPWARREEVLKEAHGQINNVQHVPQQPQNQFHNQQRQPVQPQAQQTYSSAPIHIDIRAKQVPGGQRPAPRQQPTPAPQNNNLEEDNRPNIVYVTQPLVLKHPGPGPRGAGPQSQQPNSGIRVVMPSPAASAGLGRIVPIQMEASPSPGTPSGDRSPNRQQSWSNNPTQSNSFKIIQKMTHTDEDEDDENQPITSHSPKYPQNFQQQSGIKQDEFGLKDPRYRGSDIPSKAFKILMNMTNDYDPFIGFSVGPKSPQVQPANNRGPQIRTIPIQLEGDGPTQPYVHPSEQVVPEPKKYMGSSIPSRSFKILQAMTSPDTCANKSANENENDNVSSPRNERWTFDRNLYSPYPYPPPFVPPEYFYYSNNFNNNSNNSSDQSADCDPSNHTADNNRYPLYSPVPFWSYPYPMYQNFDQKVDGSKSDFENDPEKGEPNCDYPYFDPYYYYYYYGYPPMYMYPPQMYPSDVETDINGYSSTDEMAYYSKKFASESRKPKDKDNYKSEPTHDDLATPTNEVHSTNFETRKPPAVTPEITIESAHEEEESDSDDELDDSQMEAYVFDQNYSASNTATNLQSIPSVHNINIYYETVEENEDLISENSEATTADEDVSVYSIDDGFPHQLSVIDEETERSESKQLRESSVFSDNTTVVDSEDDEVSEREVKEEITVCVKLPLKTDHVEDEVCASFTLRSPSVSPRKLSLNNEKNEQEEKDSKDSEEEVEEKPKRWSIYDEINFTHDEFVNKIENEMKVYKDSENEDTNKLETEVCLENLIDTNKEECEDKEPKINNEESDNDWWSILQKDDDNFTPPKPIFRLSLIEDRSKDSEEEVMEENHHSTHSLNSSDCKNDEFSNSNFNKEENVEDQAFDKSSDQNAEEFVQEESYEPKSIKDRIKALKDSIGEKQRRLVKRKEEIKLAVKEKIEAIKDSKDNIEETKSIPNIESPGPTFNNENGFEEDQEKDEQSEDDEIDSGVTSDLSRHISDSEETQEQKLNKYVRAATHSRLFQLLQEECDEDEAPVIEEKSKEDKFSKLSVRQRQQKSPQPQSREHLSLPLKNINEPSSSPNDKIVNELIAELLNSKKGQIFKNMSKEKLKSTALRVLQEADFDDLETPSSGYNSWLSPLRGSTESSSPAQTPQDCYNYNDYYDSWTNESNDLDVIPSKAFRMLEQGRKGYLPRCPRVLSAKSLKRDLAELLESPNSQTPSPTTHKSLTVSNAS